MGIFDIFDRRITEIAKFCASQWKGTAAIIILDIIMLVLWVLPLHNAYNNLGRKLGTYRIRKGQTINIGMGSLILAFNDVVYRINDRDTSMIYPSFYFDGFALGHGEAAGSEERFRIGHRIFLKCEPYIYTFELADLEKERNDTVAVFNVWRETLPE